MSGRWHRRDRQSFRQCLGSLSGAHHLEVQLQETRWFLPFFHLLKTNNENFHLLKRILFISPCWFYRESITTGNTFLLFSRGLEQMGLEQFLSFTFWTPSPDLDRCYDDPWPGHRAEDAYGCGSKNRYQHGTLGSGNMDQNLRFAPPPCSILSHTHIVIGLQASAFAFHGGYMNPPRFKGGN